MLSFVAHIHVGQSSAFAVFPAMTTETLLLSQSEISSLLTPEDILHTAEDVLRAHAEGHVLMPAKISLDLGDEDRWPNMNAFINAMPAYLGSLEVAGIKWAGGFWDNRLRRLPSVMAIIVLTNPATGSCLAIMDGGWITATRTAAVSALSAKHLAYRPVRTVALFGAGTQGRTHLLAFDSLFAPDEFRVYDTNTDALQAYVADMSPRTGTTITACESVEETARRADVVVTATQAREAFLSSEYLASGALVCAIGSYSEIRGDVVRWAELIVVDDREQTEHRGNLARFFARGSLRPQDIAGTLAEVVAGRLPVLTRSSKNRLVVPIGMGSVDLAVAHLAYGRAREKGVGQWFDFGSAKPLL